MLQKRIIQAKALEAGLAELNISLSTTQQDKLLAYLQLLEKWNRVHNLTAVTDPLGMVTRHLLDSLSLFPYLKEQNTIVDVGTGAGLPGIPLAIAFPDKHFTLIDSRQKKITFVQQVILSLKLRNVTAVCSPVQDFQPPHLFDAVISRAFAALEVFVEKAGHLCASQGRLIAMKGPLEENRLASLSLGYSIEKVVPLKVAGMKNCLVFIKKSIE